MLVFGGGPFRKLLGFWELSPHKQGECLLKGDPREPLSPSAMWGHREKIAICESGNALSSASNLLAPWLLNFVAFQNCEKQMFIV